MTTGDDKPFTLADFQAVADLALDAWQQGVERDWSVPAGTLTWSCLETADHVVDCVFSYALFLASRRQDDYPDWGELHANPGAGPTDMVDGLRAVTTMLAATIAAAGPEEQAILLRRPQPRTGGPADFAARGALELVLHAHDVAQGLGVPFAPDQGVCDRLFRHTADWHLDPPPPATDDRWADLLARSGRPRPPA